MQSPKKHHFLPQFYLKGFQILGDGKIPRVYIFEKWQKGKSFISAVEDAACEIDYNTIINSSGQKDRSLVETKLSRIEGKQAELIKRITTNENIEKVDLPELSFLLLLMRCRVPSVKNYIENSLKDVVRSTANILQRQGKFPPPPVEIVKIIGEGGNPFDVIEIKIFNEKILRHMFDMAMNQEGLNLLSAMNFSLVKAQENHYFITSDAPVALYVPKYEDRRPYGVGFCDKEVEITFPLNKKYLLLASWQENKPFFYATPTDVIEYNRRTVIMAQNYVYASSDNNVSNLIDKFNNFNAGFDISSGESEGGSFQISRFIPVTHIE